MAALVVHESWSVEACNSQFAPFHQPALKLVMVGVYCGSQGFIKKKKKSCQILTNMTLAGKVHQGDTGQGRKPLVEVPANSPEDGCHMVRTRRENYQDQKPLPLCFVPPAPSSGKALPDSQIRVFTSFSHKRPDMSWLSADSPQAKSSS